jgi:hypothetical protein
LLRAHIVSTKSLVKSIFPILALSVSFLSGCPLEKPEPTTQVQSETGLSEQPVVIVDGEEIPLAELDRRIERLPSYARSRLASVPSRQKHLDALADFELLADEAERKGYGDDPRVVDAVKEALAKQALGTRLAAGEEAVPPETLEERRENATVRLATEDVARALEENQ